MDRHLSVRARVHMYVQEVGAHKRKRLNKTFWSHYHSKRPRMLHRAMKPKLSANQAGAKRGDLPPLWGSVKEGGGISRIRWGEWLLDGFPIGFCFFECTLTRVRKKRTRMFTRKNVQIYEYLHIHKRMHKHAYIKENFFIL